LVFYFKSLLLDTITSALVEIEKDLSPAGRKITNSMIGLAIVIAAYALIALLGTIFNVDFLDINEGILNIVDLTK